MTISTTTTPKVQYNGSGSTGPFSVPFVFSAESDLTVVKTDSAGSDTTLVLTTNYTVSGGGTPPATGSVTLVVALAVGERLTILRNTGKTQEVDYIENDSFPAETHEGALDKLTMMVQEVDNRFDRALTLPNSTVVTDTELPNPSADQLIGWNSTADGLTNIAIGDASSFTTGDGLDLSSSVLTVDLASNPGLEFTSGDLRLKVSTGLSLGASGVAWDAALGDVNNVTITGEAKGDVLAYNGTAWVDLTVGTNGYFLRALSTEATGLVWSDGLDIFDGASLTTATVASADKVLIQDADDSSNLKTVTAQSIADLGGGGVDAASQAEMEAATSTTVYASPGRTHYHPGVAKAWIIIDGSGTASNLASYNVTSITDNGTGDFTVTWDTDFSTANYATTASCDTNSASSQQNSCEIYNIGAVGSRRFVVYNAGLVSFVDTDVLCVTAFGDQ